MGAQLTRVEDDRDDLERMSRDALWLLAKSRGVADKFPEGHNTPAVDHTNLNRPNMVQILRSLGIRGLKSDRYLGQPGTEYTVASDIIKPNVVTIDKTPRPVVPPKDVEPPISEMMRWDMMKACKKRGIKIENTDSKSILRQKLEAYEQDPSRRNQ